MTLRSRSATSRHTTRRSRGGVLADAVYPVGSIYLSTSATDPSAIFGGTWQRIEDRFLLCAGSTYGAGTTGGEASVTLKANQVPSHTHPFRYTDSPSADEKDGPYASVGSTRTYTTYNRTATQSVAASSGGGQSHNNMPPYLAVYAWKRVA